MVRVRLIREIGTKVRLHPYATQSPRFDEFDLKNSQLDQKNTECDCIRYEYYER